jgi:hypothetical protein
LKKSRSFSRKGKKPRRFFTCLVAACLLSGPGCAGIGPLFEPPLDPNSVAVLVGDLQTQNAKVQTFFSSGRLWVKDRYGEEGEANIFSAGIKGAGRIKLEITHPWGQPILHFLVDGSDFRLLSFSERKLYVGAFTEEALSTFFPEPMDRTLIWDLLRAYPVLEPPYCARSDRANRISLVSEEGVEREIILFDRESRQPKELILPRRNIKLVFSNFQESEGVRYAGETSLVHVLGGKRLTHEIEKMVFNRAIPDQVFTLQAPPGFEIVPLN